jgi:GNAT superfamily N-acetyltransferase
MTLQDRESPVAVVEHRERVWADLGAGAQFRYAAYGDATHPFFAGRRHHHLNMIGVRRSHAGRGLARRLLEAVHGLAASDPASEGVSLTTEAPRNVPFYEHFGYRVVGHARVADDLETWGLFRESM